MSIDLDEERKAVHSHCDVWSAKWTVN